MYDSIRLEAGKRYVNRLGEVIGPLVRTKQYPDRLTDKMGNWYSEMAGNYWQQYGWGCPYDLIMEYEERIDDKPADPKQIQGLGE